MSAVPISDAAPDEAAAREMMAEIKRSMPELHDVMRELYRDGLIDGARCLRFLEVDGRAYGTPSPPGVQPYLPRACFRCGQAINYASGRPHRCDERTGNDTSAARNPKGIRP